MTRDERDVAGRIAVVCRHGSRGDSPLEPVQLAEVKILAFAKTSPTVVLTVSEANDAPSDGQTLQGNSPALVQAYGDDDRDGLRIHRDLRCPVCGNHTPARAEKLRSLASAFVALHAAGQGEIELSELRRQLGRLK